MLKLLLMVKRMNGNVGRTARVDSEYFNRVNSYGIQTATIGSTMNGTSYVAVNERTVNVVENLSFPLWNLWYLWLMFILVLVSAVGIVYVEDYNRKVFSNIQHLRGGYDNLAAMKNDVEIQQNSELKENRKMEIVKKFELVEVGVGNSENADVIDL